MQRNCRLEIISVNKEENFLPCSIERDNTYNKKGNTDAEREALLPIKISLNGQ